MVRACRAGLDLPVFFGSAEDPDKAGRSGAALRTRHNGKSELFTLLVKVEQWCAACRPLPPRSGSHASVECVSLFDWVLATSSS